MSTQRSCFPSYTFQSQSLSVRVYATQADLAQDAARLACEHIRAAVEVRGSATVILAAATSQIRFLEALTASDGINWSCVTLFQMDEYFGLPAHHPASLGRFLRERVEARVRPQAFHFLQGDPLEPLRECDRYSSLLRAQPIDLCCLGIGENGHVAFNDPAVADFSDSNLTKIVKLDEACRQQQVGEGCFPDLTAVPPYGFTLTIPALAAAAKLLCVVPEKRKGMAVQRALRGPIATACPASFLRTQPQATLFLDADSASAL